ncbi:DUF4840 domain-containing protein [Chryseobacterium sp. T16E-39]|uniref:DUF4840 domain-containing protein n=1 Tax=Chryseobacterium sp. T16E-39 TaxID=2015076 RepID=UPI000B5B366C|nr:DUF4840 domain-containing protein [Chryseobacterium sp. T16E-39]ASK31331.1 DUF4840 domain-containing protein [Chryseobacterium sp. T16E-39]
MKKFIVLKAFVAVLICFVSLSLLSCNDDGPDIPPVKIQDVIGNYKGKLITTQGTNKAEATIGFTVKKDTLKFTDLPVKEIVKSVVKDPVKTEAALTAIGKVKYNINYTAVVNANYNAVEFTFTPKVLEINIPMDGAIKKTVVTFAAKEKGFYVGQNYAMKFGLVGEKITVDGVVLTPYEVIKYDFPYCIKN